MAKLNENENENENEGAGGGRSGLFAGSRYNTYKILKQAFVNATSGAGRGCSITRKFPNFKKWADGMPRTRGGSTSQEFRQPSQELVHPV